MSNFFEIDVKFIHDMGAIMSRLNIEEKGRVQQTIDSEVLRICDPYVPLETGALRDSGISNTEIGSGAVVYRTPYARKQYYVPMNHNEKRCAYWFEQMKNDGGKEKILSAAKKAVGK